ncbi:murein L,D-transpeptidase [Flavobacterium sp.]|jgi:murein L,D-transpeptidase YcbB/YkuD|uniref:murein L,D-transpeptidase n=1 Tax=Flavobacterium sp. TaxID=239 RepID=UPI0037BF7029
MKRLSFFVLSIVFGTLGLSFVSWSCNKKETNTIVSRELSSKKTYLYEDVPFDSTKVASFFVKYPKLLTFQKSIVALYKNRQYHYAWFDKKGVNEAAEMLYNKMSTVQEEGIQKNFPYKTDLDVIFQNSKTYLSPNLDAELLLSSLYFFYAKNVLTGVDEEATKKIGWYLPRKKLSYVSYLDSIIAKPELLAKDDKVVLGQYYKLKEILKKYRLSEQKGGWNPIRVAPDFKSIKPGDSSQTVSDIRTRLFATNDIASDNKSKVYDTDLVKGVVKYKKRNGFKEDEVITQKHIDEMNVPVGERIKTIIVNMERCRWISEEFLQDSEYIVVNIPSFKLTYVKNNRPEFKCNVVVGAMMTKTVIFSGKMSYIVFSPYWNLPTSIINKDVKPGMKKNKNYLVQHNMEWNNGNVRQKPGPNNSLGRVKFIFPNSNNIYLHDTPSKSLFNEESRAFSHGCIRVGKPKELAYAILKDDKNWPTDKIDAAMNKTVETTYSLKRKIPVIIGYFTAWVDDEGTINFYKDIYERDNRLSSILVEEE